jgi:hypothetical protein
LLKENVKQLQNAKHTSVNVVTSVRSEAQNQSIKDIIDLNQVESGKAYAVASAETNHTWSISFSDTLIKELKKVDGVMKAAFLRAIQHGPASTNQGQNGIKILKTQDKVRFVEIKPVGNAGGLRIFGCIEGANITLHFVGVHMDGSSSERQRENLRALCK